MNLHTLQIEVNEWSHHNFGGQPSHLPLLGAVEEIGELAHHFFKRAQRIRSNEDHNAGIADSVGDIIIYLADFCAREGLNLGNIVEDTWNQVRQRDWNKHNATGKPE